MAYVETLLRAGKAYYYLTKNVRIGSRSWRKFRVYLGNEKPSKKKLEAAARRIEREILVAGVVKQNPYPYLSDHDAETLQDLKEAYQAWSKHVPSGIKNKEYDDFVIRFTYNTNAIEGNRLTLRQTALILKDKVIPSGVRARDYNEAINGKECLDYLKQHSGDVDRRLLCKINELLVKNTDVVYPGRLRFFNVKIEGSKHLPPDHTLVKKEVRKMLQWYNNHQKLHPFELATLLHAKTAWIHPFEDGNGRTARAAMNFILLKKGYPMMFIPYEKREAYYTALESYDSGDYKAYVAQMLRLVIDQIRSYSSK
ncbi:Fic family protein [Candidatus Woesearchaeota archaeon]|nr:Fic family protein [Candidatus Woesearchaeota archaeon]